MIAQGALAGLRIIDLTQALAGPFCTMLLADLGAEVIKVEPLTGDGVRQVGPYAPDDKLRVFGGYFQSVNRNKKSVSIDLKRPEARQILTRLAAKGDVLVENYRVGVMDRLGLSYESLAKINPRLVYACIRGFGDPRTGVSPYVNWPAYDVVSQAMGGLMGITGPAPDQPLKTGPAVGDIVPAMLLAIGVLAAVRHADQTGQGQFVDVAMYDGVLALCERIVYQYSVLGQIPGPEGNTQSFLCPFDAFPASDGWVTIAAPVDHHWALLCEAIGKPELGTDPRYKTNPQRVRNAVEVRKILGDWTSARTKREILNALGGKVPCGTVNSVRDIFEDPHVEKRGMTAAVEHPGLPRLIRVANSPIKMTATPTGVRTRAPLLGEHTESVLAEFGYEKREIESLVKDGVVLTSATNPKTT